MKIVSPFLRNAMPITLKLMLPFPFAVCVFCKKLTSINDDDNKQVYAFNITLVWIFWQQLILFKTKDIAFSKRGVKYVYRTNESLKWVLIYGAFQIFPTSCSFHPCRSITSAC